MKTKRKLNLIVLMALVGLVLPSIAQVQPPDTGFTPGGGGCKSADLCPSIDGQHYGMLILNNVKYCCGALTSTPGYKNG